jgi:hypothetical protein
MVALLKFNMNASVSRLPLAFQKGPTVSPSPAQSVKFATYPLIRHLSQLIRLMLTAQ